MINFNCLLNLVDVNTYINSTNSVVENTPRLFVYKQFVKRSAEINQPFSLVNITLSSGCINKKAVSVDPEQQGKKVEFLALRGNYYKSRILKYIPKSNPKAYEYCSFNDASKVAGQPSVFDGIAFEDSLIVDKLKAQK